LRGVAREVPLPREDRAVRQLGHVRAHLAERVAVGPLHGLEHVRRAAGRVGLRGEELHDAGIAEAGDDGEVARHRRAVEAELDVAVVDEPAHEDEAVPLGGRLPGDVAALGHLDLGHARSVDDEVDGVGAPDARRRGVAHGSRRRRQRGLDPLAHGERREQGGDRDEGRGDRADGMPERRAAAGSAPGRRARHLLSPRSAVCSPS